MMPEVGLFPVLEAMKQLPRRSAAEPKRHGAVKLRWVVMTLRANQCRIPSDHPVEGARTNATPGRFDQRTLRQTALADMHVGPRLHPAEHAMRRQDEIEQPGGAAPEEISCSPKERHEASQGPELCASG